MVEVLANTMGPEDDYRGLVVATGSGGTLACGDYLKERFPSSKIAACEALQCPTLLFNGFGAHRIEGIGDKHVPWIHNVKNSDMIIAVDDEATMRLIRLFNEPVGRAYLSRQGVDKQFAQNLPLLGISSVGNLIAAVKFAKYFELGPHDVVMTVFTDSMEMYGSRIQEERHKSGDYTEFDAAMAYDRYLLGTTIDYMQELTYYERKSIHNLKYYTWVEQQGKTYEEIQAQWYDDDYWSKIHACAEELDRLIEDFNQKTGLLKAFER